MLVALQILIITKFIKKEKTQLTILSVFAGLSTRYESDNGYYTTEEQKEWFNGLLDLAYLHSFPFPILTVTGIAQMRTFLTF